jgi:hypothetical protein
MNDSYACPHCECDLSAYAVAATKAHIVCVSCAQRVAIAYDRGRDGQWYTKVVPAEGTYVSIR